MRFRQKILVSFLAILILFTLFLYPVVNRLIETILAHNMQRQTTELIGEIEKASTRAELYTLFSAAADRRFFKASLINPNQESSLRPEVREAVEGGRGFDIRFSKRYQEDMAFAALPFTFEGDLYVVQAIFPYGPIEKITSDLTLTVLLLAVIILLLFTAFAWFSLHIFTRPVQLILDAVQPYQLGQTEKIPEIKLGRAIRPSDEFGKLAETLNSLSSRIEQQISSITHEKNEKSAILESLVEGVIAVDKNSTVSYMNRMAEVFLGVSEKELARKPFSQVNNPQCEELIRMAQEKGHPVVLVLKPERKQKRFLDAVAAPRGNGGAILVLQDKTSLHKVIELGRDFIANASHELKTPITIIRGFAEALHDHPELTRDRSLEITEKIVRNCKRMDTLVKNLLTLAAVDEGLPRSRLAECDLIDLVEEARQTVLSVHPRATIRIEAMGEKPHSLLADKDLFFQAIINLLDNAIKYSQSPAEVVVRIEKRRQHFEIKISDKGIGIPPDSLDRVFERFYAVDKSHSRSLGGSGLGLSIVERIVEKHEGKIEVESQEGVGTTFTVTLPIQLY